jgi:hypothetical protein
MINPERRAKADCPPSPVAFAYKSAGLLKDDQMRQRWKIFIAIVIGLVVLVSVVTGARIYWLVQHLDDYTEAGSGFGKGKDNAACLQEALSQFKRDGSTGGALAARTFLESCLEASRPAQGFCNNVPREAEILKMIVWIRNQCSQAGIAGDGNCQKLFTRVQEYCERSSRQGAADQKPADR